MEFFRGVAVAALFCTLPSALWSAAPADPEARKIYDHDYQWLTKMPPPFIAINIRGENDKQYPERRQAALDLIREKHDLTAVPDLMDELSRRSFLSGQICEILGEWHAKKALPLLSEVAADEKRPADVRQKATAAIEKIKIPVVEAPRPTY